MMFSAILLCALISAVQGGQLLHSVSGEVNRGQFMYFILVFEGPITLNLYSRSGDADLYVSQHIAKPTYEPDSHCLQSVTCGVDTVHIPASYKRPIGIGVYGHISHDTSSYLLEATYSDEQDSDIDFFARDISAEDIEEEIQGDGSFSNPETGTSRYSDSKHSRDINPGDIDDREGEEGEVSALWTLIWPFISILVEVLVM